MKLSVIICCYNSANRLEPTLEALSLQNTSFEWEIVLVDNNSSDNTQSFAKHFWGEKGKEIDLTVVFEKQAGLSYARKKGIEEAKGELILLCDDDNHLQSDFVHRAIEIMTDDPKIGALCGKNIPLFDGEPDSFVLQNLNAYACGELAESSSFLTSTKVPWGAGLVLRKDFITTLFENGFSSLLSDRKGTELSSGGDTEFCYLIKMAGYLWKYDTSLQLKHALPSDRLNQTYLSKLEYGFGKANAVIDYYYARGNVKSLEAKASWWKVFVSSWWSMVKKGKTVSSFFKKGYLHQLWADRAVFNEKRSQVQELLNKLHVR